MIVSSTKCTAEENVKVIYALVAISKWLEFTCCQPSIDQSNFKTWSALNSTLVVDKAHINYVEKSEDLETATVRAGIRLGRHILSSGTGPYHYRWHLSKRSSGRLCYCWRLQHVDAAM